jgi:hypothetical protein
MNRITKERTCQFSIGYDCIEDVNSGVWRLRVWDDDGDYFFFFRALLCPEADIVYISHMYEFSFHSFVDFEDRHESPPRELDAMTLSVLHEIFPGYTKIRPYPGLPSNHTIDMRETLHAPRDDFAAILRTHFP